jgi:hypothetical protein
MIWERIGAVLPGHVTLRRCVRCPQTRWAPTGVPVILRSATLNGECRPLPGSARRHRQLGLHDRFVSGDLHHRVDISKSHIDMGQRRQASMRMIGLLRRPRTRTKPAQVTGSSEHRCAYEPQTTFPAFTVVLIFMAFSLLPEIADRPG